MLIRLATQSLLNRRISFLLTVLSIAMSVFVLIGVEHFRHQAKTSFARTVSDVDLIVGARTGQLNLLLYSVFRMGEATNNIAWTSYESVAKHSKVAWTIPISLGDSHRGYRVMGTNTSYFDHFKYGNKQPLQFSQGVAFSNVYDAVIGAEVAKKLNYTIGRKITLSHGLGEISFSNHDDKPFTVVGVLAPTGTAVDRTVHVSLQAIEAIHTGWHHGVKVSNTLELSEQELLNLRPKTITAFMLGLHSKGSTFSVQRFVNNYKKEPLLAILPGATLMQLWQMLSVAESALLIVSILVLFSALIGLVTMLLASMRERLRELAILRAIGAKPFFIFILVQAEVFIITLMAIVISVLALWGGVLAMQPYLEAQYGLFIDANIFNLETLRIAGMVLAGAILTGIVPAVTAYRSTLNRGLMVTH